MIALTVIVATHNPHPERLARTLRALRAQTLDPAVWQLLLVDNGSSPALEVADLATHSPSRFRIVREELLGLSHARRRGFLEAVGEFFVLVDDDNVLAESYLSRVLDHFSAHPRLGVIGGPCRPEFERAPEPWTQEFSPLLALRDLGPQPLSAGLRSPGSTRDSYPDCAPIGAGMALRRAAAHAWLERADPAALTDRRGRDLSSGGDNDIVICALRAGWIAGYFPDLAVTHLIPAVRLSPAYLARLNRGIQKSWLALLLHHGLSDWPTIPKWSVPLRQTKAWFTHRAWASAAARIRWQGACGHFEGRVLPSRS